MDFLRLYILPNTSSSACGVLTDISAPRGNAKHCSTRSPCTRSGAYSMCFARLVGSLTGSLPRPLKLVLRGGLSGIQRAVNWDTIKGWYHSIALPYNYAHNVRNKRTRPDPQNAEIGSETWKNRRGNLVGTRIEIRLAHKVRHKPKQ